MSLRINLLLLFCALVVGLSVDLSCTAQAEATSSRFSAEHSIWDLPSIPDLEIDIGYWSIIVAHECDSTVEVTRYLSMLDTMAAQIIFMVGPREGDMVRFAMTRTYLYEPGEWNGGHVFSYDLDDPLGDKPDAKLLPTYLDTHRGNCVTMPTLFLALMERVDPAVPFCGVSAPLHLFCRLHDRQDGSVWNVEATNGGNSMRDEWVIEQFRISQTAIDSGAYLRDMTKKEYVAALLGTLVSRYCRAGEYDKALSYADLVLEVSSRSIGGLVQKGSVLAWQGQTLKERILAERRKPTPVELDSLKFYAIESDRYIQRAESLGWEPETPESRERYLQTIRAAKSSKSE